MTTNNRHDWASGRLTARPAQPTRRGQRGRVLLRIGGQPCAIFVPLRYRASHPAPLLLWLHGAGGRVQQWTPALWPLAETTGIIVIAPKSSDSTWDRTKENRFGKDTQAINGALEHALASYAIDSRRIAIGGFSDGATYSLSLGLTNGDLFTHILAFSPGGMKPGERHGRPEIFITHGTADKTLRIDSCSRKIVPRLSKDGYDVLYRETRWGHVPAPQVVPQTILWFLKTPAKVKDESEPSAPGSHR